MKKLMLILMMCVLCISLASAKPVVQSSNTGYTLRLGNVDYIKQGVDVTLNVHLYNQSNSMPITSGASCYLHLYSGAGAHGLVMETQTVDHLFDYEFDIDGGNFSGKGVRNYLVQCNNTADGLGGYATNSVEVTHNGKGAPHPTLIVAFSILFLILIAFSIVSVLKTIGHWLNLEVDIMDVAMDWGLYFTVFATYYLSNLYLGNPLIDEIFLIAVKVGAVTHVIVPVFALFTSYFFHPERWMRGKNA